LVGGGCKLGFLGGILGISLGEIVRGLVNAG